MAGTFTLARGPSGAADIDNYAVVTNAHCMRGGDSLHGGFPGMAGAIQPPGVASRDTFDTYLVKGSARTLITAIANYEK